MTNKETVEMWFINNGLIVTEYKGMDEILITRTMKLMLEGDAVDLVNVVTEFGITLDSVYRWVAEEIEVNNDPHISHLNYNKDMVDEIKDLL